MSLLAAPLVLSVILVGCGAQCIDQCVNENNGCLNKIYVERNHSICIQACQTDDVDDFLRSGNLNDHDHQLEIIDKNIQLTNRRPEEESLYIVYNEPLRVYVIVFEKCNEECKVLWVFRSPYRFRANSESCSPTTLSTKHSTVNPATKVKQTIKLQK